MKQTWVIYVLGLALALLAGCIFAPSHAGRNSVQINTDYWVSRELHEYGLTFRCPPVAAFGDLGSWLPGQTIVDGRYKPPYAIQMRPRYSRHLLAGVAYDFSIRFMMITDKAQLTPLHAKREGWVERPKTDLYPFDYGQDKQALLTAVERLYLCAPIKWQGIKPTTVDGKQGVWMSGWDERIKDSKYFHEIVAAPIGTNRILLVQAGYFRIASSAQLGLERSVFTNVVNSIRISRPGN